MAVSDDAHPLICVWCRAATHFLAQNMNHDSNIHSGSLTPLATNHSPGLARSKQLKGSTQFSMSYTEVSESVFSTSSAAWAKPWCSSKCHCIRSTSESTSLHLPSRNPWPQQLPARQGCFKRSQGRTATGQEALFQSPSHAQRRSRLAVFFTTCFCSPQTSVLSDCVRPVFCRPCFILHTKGPVLMVFFSCRGSSTFPLWWSIIQEADICSLQIRHGLLG